MKIKAIVPYYGGKRTLAGEIVKELGPHKMYVEPFCGSMAVVLSKKLSGSDIVNDLHGDVINLARVIASERGKDLFERLYRTMDSEDIFEEAKEKFLRQPRPEPSAKGQKIKDEQVERAYIYFVMSWQGRNGVSGSRRNNYQKAKRWTPGGGSGAVRFASAVDSIPDWFERLRRVNIYCMDAFELLEKLEDDKQTAIYMDPPYLRSSLGLRSARWVGELYVHDFEDKDHQRLAEAAGRFKKARVVVSYYEDEKLVELYPKDKWSRRRVYYRKALPAANKRGSKPVLAPEILIMNGPSLVKEEKGLFEK